MKQHNCLALLVSTVLVSYTLGIRKGQEVSNGVATEVLLPL